jgi:hypothetical protein
MVVSPTRFGSRPTGRRLDPIAVDRDGRADLRAVTKTGAKGVGDLSVAGIHVAVNLIRRHRNLENHRHASERRLSQR